MLASVPLMERAGIRKSRVGGWRILFSVDRDAEILYILTVDTRRSSLQAFVTDSAPSEREYECAEWLPKLRYREYWQCPRPTSALVI